MSFFIAEVSSNHSQNLNRALKFIDIASEIGCDAVKFQLFKIEKLFSQEVLESSKEHLARKAWELPLDFLPHLKKRSGEKGIQLGFSPFYIEAVDELEPFVDFFKIASYELLWDDLLIKCAYTKKPVIISTGMANMSEIIHAVKILRSHGCEPKVLHCTSSYPTKYFEANLSAIETIRKNTGCLVGWSDHTVNKAVISRAIHRWNADVIEFHIDIEGDGEEFNSGHCWLPNDMKKLINEVSEGLSADGNGVKEPIDAEIDDRLWRTDPSDGLRPFKSIRDKLRKK